MKKICLTAIAATAMLFSVNSATAQVYEEGSTQQQEVQKKDEMTKIEVQEIPAEVRESVERDFQGATVSEAYVKGKEGEAEYKLVITTTEGETKELFADAKGNWIDKKGKDSE